MRFGNEAMQMSNVIKYQKLISIVLFSSILNFNLIYINLKLCLVPSSSTENATFQLYFSAKKVSVDNNLSLTMQ